MFRIAVTDDRLGDYGIERSILAQAGGTLDVLDLRPDGEAVPFLRDYDALLVNLFPMDRKIIEGLTRCRILQRYGVGYDNVDVAAATEKGIWVATVPDYSVEEVSDHALGLILACTRNIAFTDRNIRRGGWNLAGKQKNYRIRDKILGIVGFGAIARRLNAKVQGFGFSRILVYDPYVPADQIAAAGGEKTELDTLLQQADYITLHLPLTEKTRGIIGSEAFSLMKSQAVIINTCRGPVIQEAALAEALRSGHIGAAGIDVFETEPLPEASPLRSMENVVLSDHSSWYSEESVAELRRKAAENVVLALTTGRPQYFVNRIE
jgi:D-3-phosphoglycerate dehydrogenase / 2-oxoglutarate reductase